MINPALIKPTVTFAVGLCSSRVAGRIVRANVTSVTTLQKVEVAVAAYGIGAAVGSAASYAVEQELAQAEELLKTVKELKNQKQA